METIRTFNKTIKIGDRTIGVGQPSYIIAEIGANFDHDIEKAKHDIDFSIGLAYDLEFMVRNIDIREVDPKSFRNDYLCNIQTNVFQMNAMVVDYIIKI